MRIFIHLICVTIVFNGCGTKREDLTDEIISMDTIYSGDFIWRQKMESKRLTILFDNGKDLERPVFKLNEENLLRIRVKRLFEYDVIPSEIHGAEIVKVDTSANLFLVTPTDTSFSFVVNQYYPKGRVIRCVRNWNSEINDYEEYLTPLNGFKTVMHFEGSTK